MMVVTGNYACVDLGGNRSLMNQIVLNDAFVESTDEKANPSSERCGAIPYASPFRTSPLLSYRMHNTTSSV